MPLNHTQSRIAGVALLLCLVVAATVADRSTPKPSPQHTESRRLLIRSGTLYTKDGVPINLSGFDSEIQSDKTESNNSSSKPQIRDVIVRSGEAFVRAQDIATLLRSHMSGDKISDLSVESSGEELKISGNLKGKAIPAHFEIKGPVTLSPNGQIDLHERSKKLDKLPLGLFGVDTSKVVGNSHGISATKDDILMDPNTLWGMSVHGKLTAVKLVKDGLALVYGPSSPTVARALKGHHSKR